MRKLPPVCTKCDRRGYVQVKTADDRLEWRCDYHVTDSYPVRVRNRITRRQNSRMVLQ